MCLDSHLSGSIVAIIVVVFSVIATVIIIFVVMPSISITIKNKTVNCNETVKNINTNNTRASGIGTNSPDSKSPTCVHYNKKFTDNLESKTSIDHK